MKGNNGVSEISNFKVFIDPAQNVLITGQLNITVSVLPTATAEYINVNLGFVTSL